MNNVEEIRSILKSIKNIREHVVEKLSSCNSFCFGDDPQLLNKILTYCVFAQFNIINSSLELGVAGKGGTRFYFYLEDDKYVYFVNNEQIISRKRFNSFFDKIKINNKVIKYFNIKDDLSFSISDFHSSNTKKLKKEEKDESYINDVKVMF